MPCQTGRKPVRYRAVLCGTRASASGQTPFSLRSARTFGVTAQPLLFYPDYFVPENGPAVHVLRESEAKAWQFDIIHMQGDVEAMLGDAVEATVRAVLN